jgi:ribosomal protein S25
MEIAEILLENDSTLNKIIHACQNELARRKLEKVQNAAMFNRLVRNYFQDDVGKLSFISEHGFLQYEGVNIDILNIARKELSKRKKTFYND